MKGEKCPACGSTNTVEIVYGMPTEKAVEAELRGELVLGGCVIKQNSPAMHCKECGQDFGKRETKR